MADVMVWVTKRPDDEGDDAPSLRDLGERVGRLGGVTGVDVRAEGGVLHVSFEGGKAEREQIEGAVREAGYGIFKPSRREG